MVNLKKFINIPYVFNGDTFDGADCAGLVKLFYEQNGWQLPHFNKPEYQWYLKRPMSMERYLLKHFDKSRDINELTYGDIVYFSINGEGHVGIILNYGKLLMTYPKINEFNGGISFIDRTKYWFNIPGVKFIAGFKRREVI